MSGYHIWLRTTNKWLRCIDSSNFGDIIAYTSGDPPPTTFTSIADAFKVIFEHKLSMLEAWILLEKEFPIRISGEDKYSIRIACDTGSIYVGYHPPEAVHEGVWPLAFGAEAISSGKTADTEYVVWLPQWNAYLKSFRTSTNSRNEALRFNDPYGAVYALSCAINSSDFFAMYCDMWILPDTLITKFYPLFSFRTSKGKHIRFYTVDAEKVKAEIFKEDLTMTTKEAPKKFWVVWCPTGGNPTHKHATFDLADAEAQRLSNKTPDKEFYVLESKRLVTTATTTTTASTNLV